MPFYGKCGFCYGHGHNVKMCSHPNKAAVINDMKDELGLLTTKREINEYVCRLSPLHLELLATEIGVSSGIPQILMRKYVRNHYVCNLELRNMRWRRYADDLEEGATHSPQPHSLFRRCVEVFSFIGSRIVSIATGRQPTHNTYTPLRSPEPKKWQIVPSLEFAEKAQKKECPICFEMKPMLNIITPQCNCNHSICNGCFGNYVNKSSNIAPKCPLCRTTIQSVSVYDIYTYNEYVDKYMD